MLWLEGIIPALEPSHALAFAAKQLPLMDKEQIVILNMCGRGDKDLETVLPKLMSAGYYKKLKIRSKQIK